MKEPASRRFRVLFKTTNYNVLIGDDVIEVDASGGAVTITLYKADRFSGGMVVVKKLTSGPLLTVDTTGADTIDGSVSRNLAAQWTSLILYSNGTDWRTI